MEENINFGIAYKRLKQISDFLKSQEIVDVDKILALQKEAEELYLFCVEKLKKISK